ncbi:hypothetical protein AAFF_G00433340 [Aldrovandia affinis]|uniref:Ankyrin repeat and SOCS box protein 11 n=1 Tax=Aldrovandia affinis TaxID=143900 RepID=A0AAD7S951_9TELE|nr:hypothetical protein AAFF_G00433340 [Aldrovandia affinis]
MSKRFTPHLQSCTAKRQDITGISDLSWGSRKDLYGNYIVHTFQGGSWADRSPLHEVASEGHLLSLKTLILQGFNVNILTMDRVSPLHDACLGSHATCAKFLLENGANANSVTINGATPLFCACCSGSADCVSLLLEYCPAPHPAHLVAPPLHEAAKRGHRECMEMLLAHGLNIDLEIPRQGTPLYAACVSQRTDIVERLLQLGAVKKHRIGHTGYPRPRKTFRADVQCGKAQDSPLHAAAQGPSVRLLELLLEYGADVRSRNNEGKRPVELATPGSPVEKALQLREGPSVLSQLCRLCIRRALGRPRLHMAPTLPLPHQLGAFLLYR